MTAIAPEGTRTVQPPANADPGPREPVSARAQIISIADERRRECVKEIAECSERLKRLLMEEAQLRHCLQAAGVMEGE
jgi:hypothetical protein